uniref:Uncharacterized protein n=1 Tax=Marseillevirus LCMAC101 TaxID=2506602 RepID=A0A481YTF4_9VIRU|nr:MAG: hypothetical protein LCMAC101_03890 [Marseillevirus LCMAC101]
MANLDEQELQELIITVRLGTMTEYREIVLKDIFDLYLDREAALFDELVENLKCGVIATFIGEEKLEKIDKKVVIKISVGEEHSTVISKIYKLYPMSPYLDSLFRKFVDKVEWYMPEKRCPKKGVKTVIREAVVKISFDETERSKTFTTIHHLPPSEIKRLFSNYDDSMNMAMRSAFSQEQTN